MIVQRTFFAAQNYFGFTHIEVKSHLFMLRLDVIYNQCNVHYSLTIDYNVLEECRRS